MSRSINESDLSRSQIKRLVRKALAKLPEEDRALIEALYFENISIHKLAKQLGIARAAIRYRRGKALEKLRKEIL